VLYGATETVCGKEGDARQLNRWRKLVVVATRPTPARSARKATELAGATGSASGTTPTASAGSIGAERGVMYPVQHRDQLGVRGVHGAT